VIDEELILKHKDSKLERTVLGTLIVFPEVYAEVAHLMHEKLFTSQVNRIIFQTIGELLAEKKQIDAITVSFKVKEREDVQKLIKDTGWSPMKDIGEMIALVVGNKNTEAHIKILTSLWKSRELAFLLLDGINMVNNQKKHKEIIDKIQTGITGIEVIGMSEFNVNDELIALIKGLEVEPEYVHSHIPEIDSIIKGWEKSDFVVLAGAPGMGKTALALQIFLNQVLHGSGVGFFSLEMSKEQLFRRIVSMFTNINSIKLRNRQLNQYDWQKIHNFTSAMQDRVWEIDDRSGDLNGVISKIRKMAIKDHIQVVIIDYIQLITCNKKTGTREQEVSTITRALKSIARELQITIIGLSQISRDVEKRENKRPRLSDLRESGAIEQDADMVMFTYRPDYYNIHEEPKPVQQVEVIIGKGRHTGTGTAYLNFVPHLTKYISSSDVQAYEV